MLQDNTHLHVVFMVEIKKTWPVAESHSQMKIMEITLTNEDYGRIMYSPIQDETLWGEQHSCRYKHQLNLTNTQSCSLCK